MEEGAQPGKIPTPSKIAGIKPLNTPSKAVETSERPQEALLGRATTFVTSRFAQENAQSRVNKTLTRYEKSGSIPSKPKYRVSLLEGGIVIAIAAIVDLVEIIAGFLFETAIGEAVNLIIDIVFGIILIIYCAIFKRLTFADHWQRYASIAGAFIGEAIPIINIASFWIFDAWYIIHSIRQEDRNAHNQAVDILTRQYQQEQVTEDEQAIAEAYMASYPEEDVVE